MDPAQNKTVLMRVAAIVDSGSSGSYNLVLQEAQGHRRIVMSIGLAEAQSIAVFMEGVRLPRPLSHDLMAQMTKAFGVDVCEVVIEDLHNGYFISNIVCQTDEQMYIFDARTSDAVAFALRCGAPVYARESVLSMLAGPPAETIRQSQRPRLLADMADEELRELLDVAVAEENYERAKEIQHVLNTRTSEMPPF